MTPYREILRLNSRGISQRSIAASCECSRNTVSQIEKRAGEINLGWPLKAELTDGDLETILFPISVSLTPLRRSPDLEYIPKEMAKSGVNLRLLWTEYCTTCRLANDQPLMYSQFCYHYQKYALASQLRKLD